MHLNVSFSPELQTALNIKSFLEGAIIYQLQICGYGSGLQLAS